MSSHLKETTVVKAIRTGVGTSSTTAQALGAVNNQRACKGVTIKNLDGTDILYVGNSENVSASTGYAIGPGQEVKIEVEDPWNLWIIAFANTPVYTWIAV